MLEDRDTKPEADPQPTTRSVTAAPHKESSRRPEEQVEPDVLTFENSPDLAAVLAEPKKGRTVKVFSEKYLLKVVEFDAFVTVPAKLGNGAGVRLVLEAPSPQAHSRLTKGFTGAAGVFT